MEITEEQRRRAEANRLAALEKRKRAAEASNDNPWRLFKCQKIPVITPPVSGAPQPVPAKNQEMPPLPLSPLRFRIVLEICSPDEFSISPEPSEDSLFPGENECFRIIEAALLSVVPFWMSESQTGRKYSIYKLVDYELVIKCLKKLTGVELQDIPYTTRVVVEKFSQCVGDNWVPLMEGHYSDEQVDELFGRLPKSLRDALLPFQLEGVKFGLRRGGRCLIADEMGLGKTLQAIAISYCFKDEGPILIVCPAVLRYSWAEELEHWLPTFLPKDIHLVFGHQNSLDHLEACPKVVVVSYKMLSRLSKSMLEREWALVIIDESHNIRCTRKKSEKEETRVILQLATMVKRIILLSGTPSLSRPYDIYHQINLLWPRLLGNDKYEFAKNYCLMRSAQGSHGKTYQDFSKGTRLPELNVLLRQTLMIRRLKDHVLAQLPPKRRQIIRVKLKVADIVLATKLCSLTGGTIIEMEHAEELLDGCCTNISGSEKMEKTFTNDLGCKKSSKLLSPQEIGIAKLSEFREWFFNHSTIGISDSDNSLDMGLDTQKMIIFAHHLKVLDGIQAFISENGIKFVRIDGSTLARDRQEAVEAFRLSAEVKIAIIGITAGGVGLNFSSAQNVVFLELPKSASEMLQAEDRAHRRGQKNAVNIYIFCAKDTSDESHWQHLNKSLFRVSSMMNGKEDSIREIEVERVVHLEHSSKNANQACSEETVKPALQACRIYREALEESENTTIEHIEEDTCFSICTVPHRLEDDICHDLDVQECPTLYSNWKCNNPVISQADQSCGTSNCDLVKRNSEFDLLGVRAYKVGKRFSLGGKCDMNNHIEAEFLRFEVSQHTGRIHLYICIPGKDSRPRPLFENFRPEELDSLACSSGQEKKEETLQVLKENPKLCCVFTSFIKEWSSLRPIDRNKLLGKPLELPLSLELCYLKGNMNHSSEGLLKGGSKRRVTPLSDISCPLPENAVWKNVILHGGTAKEKKYSQAWTVDDEPLCKLCQGPCCGNLAKAPEYFEDLFCKLSCYQEFRIRTSQRALRQALFQLERGICAQCKLDCCRLVKAVRVLSIRKRREYIEKVAPKLASKKRLLNKLIHEPNEGNAWHADHIVPVYRGGGECRLENMRTLCVACHYEITNAQRTELRVMRMRAKEHLKIAMKGFQEGNSTEPIVSVEVSTYIVTSGLNLNIYRLVASVFLYVNYLIRICIWRNYGNELYSDVTANLKRWSITLCIIVFSFFLSVSMSFYYTVHIIDIL
ncbi:uncharacterized protein [Typha angustifolia]|uniref:uncharacterized protein isoform X2 n=1 Tax=Typha angustifolia TaxID=59011 RepID=UPI003C2DADC6